MRHFIQLFSVHPRFWWGGGIPMLLMLAASCGGNSIESLPKASAMAAVSAGWNLYLQEQYEGARVEFNDAVRTDPTLPDGYNGLGWSLFRLRRPPLALLQFQAGIATDTSNTIEFRDMLIGLAFTHFELDRFDQSMVAVRRAVNIDTTQFDLVGDDYLHDHDGFVSSAEVRKLEALNEYYQGHFEQSLDIVRRYLNPGTTIDPTQAGYEGALLRELENL